MNETILSHSKEDSSHNINSSIEKFNISQNSRNYETNKDTNDSSICDRKGNILKLLLLLF